MNGRMARREGCYNSGSGNSNCRQWMNQLRILDFTMTELILYLDAYPESQEALSYYRKLRQQRQKLIADMEAAGCAPITAFDAGGDGTSWNWSMGPWPWESEAN